MNQVDGIQNSLQFANTRTLAVILIMMRYLIIVVTFCTCVASSTAHGQDVETKELLKKIHNGTDARRDSIANAYTVLREKLGKIEDSVTKHQLLKSIDSLDRASEENNLMELLLEFDFIEKNPSHPLSVEIMLYKIYRRESLNSHDTFKALYGKLTSALKESEQGRKLKDVLSQIENSRIGSFAPDFNFIDMNGQNLTLASFRNKSYVLLDFWASWCIPCRADFPFLKGLYSQYHSKGLEIINISRDDDLNSWRDAIKKDGISIWRQLATKQNSNNILSDYFVSAIPVKVLIDRDGRIIGRWRGGGEANKKDLADTLLRYLGTD